MHKMLALLVRLVYNMCVSKKEAKEYPMSNNFEMFGAEEGWEQPVVGDLVEIFSKSSLKRLVGVVVPPCDYIKNDHLWAQVLLDNGKMKVYHKRELKVIQRGEQ